MNQQIRELAEQAGYTPLPGFDFANELQEVFLKKFAELIVKECAKISLECGINLNREDFRQGIARNIKEHFGVEE